MRYSFVVAVGSDPVAAQQLAGQGFVGLRPIGSGGIGQDGQTIGWSFGQADAARHDRLEDLAGEVPVDLRHHIGGQVRARIEHGQHDAAHLQPGKQGLAHALDGLCQHAQALQRQVLALHRHQRAVLGGDQAVDRQQPKRRRAIDQDVVVAAEQRLQGPLEALLTVFLVHQFHLRARPAPARMAAV